MDKDKRPPFIHTTNSTHAWHAPLAQVISNNSNLKDLHISESLAFNKIQSELLSSAKLKYLFLYLVQPDKLSINCENLETLVIRGCNTIKHQELSNIIQRSKKLSPLSLNSLKCLNSQNIKLIGDFLSIRYLSLKKNYVNLGSNQMHKSHFPKLKELSLKKLFVSVGAKNGTYRSKYQPNHSENQLISKSLIKEDFKGVWTKTFRMKFLVSVTRALVRKKYIKILEQYLERRKIEYLCTQQIEQIEISQYSYQ